MKKGFTIVELLIAVVVVGILAAIIITAVKNSTGLEPMTEKEECALYENHAQKDLPVKCLKYYGLGK